jgi:RNA polymerase sigma factor (sigma-70 family)
MMNSAPVFTPASGYTPAMIVHGIRAGDDSAWRELIQRYEPLLRWLARQHGLPAEDAADVAQLTWLHCYQHIGQLADADRLGGWLATICRRECIRLATRKRREVPLAEPDVTQFAGEEDEQRDPCSEVARRDEHDRLHRAITALPDRQRTVLVELLQRERQSYLDLSRRLGLPVGSIGPTWKRALVRLRRDPRLAVPPESSRRPLLDEQSA